MFKKSLPIIPFIISFFLLLPSSSLAGQFKVTRVVDGDTIVVDYKGKPEKIRLLCVNTPESVHPDAKQNVPMGKVASDYGNKSLLLEALSSLDNSNVGVVQLLWITGSVKLRYR
jgi:endonuclease YncB( thermonuclease family)